MFGFKTSLLKQSKTSKSIISILLSMLMLLSVLLSPFTFTYEVHATSLTAGVASGSTTIGEILYGLFSAAGATPVLVPGTLSGSSTSFPIKDAAFSKEGSIENLMKNGCITGENGEILNYQDWASWNREKQLRTDFTKAIEWVKSKAELGESDFGKNTVVPCTVTYEKIAPGLPGGPTPTPGGGGLIKSGVKWLGERLKIAALAGCITLESLGIAPSPAQPPVMTQVVQEMYQPVSSNTIDSDLLSSDYVTNDFLADLGNSPYYYLSIQNAVGFFQYDLYLCDYGAICTTPSSSSQLGEHYVGNIRKRYLFNKRLDGSLDSDYPTWTFINHTYPFRMKYSPNISPYREYKTNLPQVPKNIYDSIQFPSDNSPLRNPFLVSQYGNFNKDDNLSPVINNNQVYNYPTNEQIYNVDAPLK